MCSRSNYDSTSVDTTLGRRFNQLLDLESRVRSLRKSYFVSILAWPSPRMCRGILLIGCDPGLIGCLVCQIYETGHRVDARPCRRNLVLDQELLSDSGQSQGLCVLGR